MNKIQFSDVIVTTPRGYMKFCVQNVNKLNEIKIAKL